MSSCKKVEYFITCSRYVFGLKSCNLIGLNSFGPIWLKNKLYNRFIDFTCGYKDDREVRWKKPKNGFIIMKSNYSYMVLELTSSFSWSTNHILTRLHITLQTTLTSSYYIAGLFNLRQKVSVCLPVCLSDWQSVCLSIFMYCGSHHTSWSISSAVLKILLLFEILLSYVKTKF